MIMDYKPPVEHHCNIGDMECTRRRRPFYPSKLVQAKRVDKTITLDPYEDLLVPLNKVIDAIYLNIDWSKPSREEIEMIEELVVVMNDIRAHYEKVMDANRMLYEY